MVLLAHILIAVASVGYTTYVFFSPSRSKLRGAYALVALTLLSGTYLAVSSPAHILQTCISGLTYTAAVTAGIIAIQYRLAAAENRTKSGDR